MMLEKDAWVPHNCWEKVYRTKNEMSATHEVFNETQTKRERYDRRYKTLLVLFGDEEHQKENSSFSRVVD